MPAPLICSSCYSAGKADYGVPLSQLARSQVRNPPKPSTTGALLDSAALPLLIYAYLPQARSTHSAR